MNSEPDPVHAEVQRIMQYAVIADLKSESAELSRFYSGLNECDRAQLLVLLGQAD